MNNPEGGAEREEQRGGQRGEQQQVCGTLIPHCPIGMLSKSRGQILRVAATLHMLFNMDKPNDIPEEIGEIALLAAEDYVGVMLLTLLVEA